MPSTSDIAATTTRFAFKLFRAVAAGAPNQIVFIPPASVALALALAANGARGDTWRALAQALDLGDLDLDGLNRASADMLRALGQADPQVELALASSLWVRHGWALDP